MSKNRPQAPVADERTFEAVPAEPPVQYVEPHRPMTAAERSVQLGIILEACELDKNSIYDTGDLRERLKAAATAARTLLTGNE